MLTSRRLGSQTQLQRATSAAPVAKGAKGTGVAEMQDLLVDLGFTLTKTMARGKADGIFGVETEAAVKDFQKRNSLKPDGMAGPVTLGLLDSLIQRFPVLETPDPVVEAAKTAVDSGKPIGRRRSGYW